LHLFVIYDIVNKKSFKKLKWKNGPLRFNKTFSLVYTIGGYKGYRGKERTKGVRAEIPSTRTGKSLPHAASSKRGKSVYYFIL
jgi:hypothetical protein